MFTYALECAQAITKNLDTLIAEHIIDEIEADGKETVELIKK